MLEEEMVKPAQQALVEAKEAGAPGATSGPVPPAIASQTAPAGQECSLFQIG